jgi:protein TonB
MLTFLAVAAAFLFALIGTGILFKTIIDRSGQKILLQGADGEESSSLVKKFADVDIDKYSTLLLCIGFIFSLSLTYVAFEWKTYDEIKISDLGVMDVTEEAVEIPPVTEQPPPPPMQVLQQPEIVEVPDEKKIEEDVKINLDVEVTQETTIKEVIKQPVVEAPKEEEVEEIFTVVEESAEPNGGMEAFRKYLEKNLKYPKQARKMGVEGKVFVQFVVDKDGSISDVKAIKGIGAGCDEEAIRIIQESPKWKPGKQRGRPVKVRVVVPIVFKLG